MEIKQQEPIDNLHVQNLCFFNNIITPMSFAPPTYGTAPTLYRELAGHSQPMGAASCQRLQVGIDISSIPDISTNHSGDQGRGSSGWRGSPKAAGQRGNKGCQPMQPIYQQHILGTKEGRLLQTSYQSQTTKSVHGYNALHDGESGHVEGLAEVRRLDGIDRLEGCVSLGGDLGGTPEIPAIHVE